MERQVYRGVRYLKRFLQKKSLDFHMLDRERFKTWLTRQIDRRQNDAIFVQRCKIRDIKKKYKKKLTALEDRLGEAKRQWQLCGDRIYIEQLETDIANSHKAILGLSQAIKDRTGEKRKTCKKKLDAFQNRLEILRQNLSEACKNNPKKELLEHAHKALKAYENSLGITENEVLLKQLSVKRGHDASNAGSSFEKAVQEIVLKEIVPFLLRKSKMPKSQRERQICVLSQVTLGCARAELDYVVVRQCDPKKPVSVLGVIEVKRNINDVAGGFEIRQENLAWFSGAKNGYDPKIYRTKVFRDGHFDVSTRHEQNGVSFLFTRDSFRHFCRDAKSSYFLNRLFFITRKRFLQGLSSSEYSQLLYRIAVDTSFDLENNAYLEKLLSQLQTTISSMQSKHVLELYTTSYKTGQQFYFVV